MRIVVLLAGLLLIVSCASPPSESGEQPVRYAKDVNVAIYDETTRPPTSKLEVFNSEQDLKGRPFRIIAKLSRHGRIKDQALIENAIAWRARKLGGEGLIWIPMFEPRGWKNRNEEPMFSANVIVFENPQGNR